MVTSFIIDTFLQKHNFKQPSTVGESTRSSTKLFNGSVDQPRRELPEGTNSRVKHTRSRWPTVSGICRVGVRLDAGITEDMTI